MYIMMKTGCCFQITVPYFSYICLLVFCCVHLFNILHLLLEQEAVPECKPLVYNSCEPTAVQGSFRGVQVM